MSLTNPNTPVSQQDLQDFYHKILPYMGGGSGGGGGGHTIEDYEGTDLTQRDTLQFGDGFSAEDDSQNEKTVISPNLMTSGDMDDVVSPLPMTTTRAFVVNKFSKGDLYSSTEKMIGRWKDGKPLYQITVEYDGSSMIFDGQTTNQLPIIRDVSIDTVVEFRGIFGREDGGARDFFNTPSTRVDNIIYQTQINIGLNPNTVYFLSKNSTTKKLWVTLQYTKATDSADVPISDGNDYSTSEQIVGTWITGEPIYQKTFQTTIASTAGTTAIDVSSLGIEHIISYNGFHFDSDYEGCIPLPATNSKTLFPYYQKSNGTVYIYCDYAGYYGRTLYFTIQYTKSTS